MRSIKDKIGMIPHQARVDKAGCVDASLIHLDWHHHPFRSHRELPFTERRDAPLGVVLAQASFGSWTNTPCLGTKKHSSYYATMVHRGTAGIPPALRAGSYRYRLQERSGQSRVGHGITLPVAARAIQPLCGQHLSVTTSCGRSCPTAPGGCLPHVGRPVAACAATGCPAPIEWLIDIAS